MSDAFDEQPGLSSCNLRIGQVALRDRHHPALDPERSQHRGVLARLRHDAVVGGGALPLLELEGPVARVGDPAPDRLAARLRAGDPPLIGRIADGALLLDPRTMTDDEVEVACRPR